MCYIATIITSKIGFVKHLSAGAFLEGPEGGNPACVRSWIPAFAGMTGRGCWRCKFWPASSATGMLVVRGESIGDGRLDGEATAAWARSARREWRSEGEEGHIARAVGLSAVGEEGGCANGAGPVDRDV